ncbi:MAG: hypothetical protein ACTSQG_05280 [Promethearchaeota archaeon]
MGRYLKKYNKKYKRRYKGIYVDLTKPKVTTKSKIAGAYKTLTSPKAKAKYKKASKMIGKGFAHTKRYFEGASRGLDSALGIPTKNPDYVLVTKVPKGYKLVKKRRKR